MTESQKGKDAANETKAPKSADLNEQLRQDARELRAVAEKYIVEEGRVITRATIPPK